MIGDAPTAPDTLDSPGRIVPDSLIIVGEPLLVSLGGVIAERAGGLFFAPSLRRVSLPGCRPTGEGQGGAAANVDRRVGQPTLRRAQQPLPDCPGRLCDDWRSHW